VGTRLVTSPGGGPTRVPETSYARSGDIHIAYQVIGDGPLDLVFVPGVLSHLDLMWEEGSWSQRFFTRLASFSRLILFDKRGTGLSDRNVGSATLEERMDDVRAVMDAAGSERAAVIGYSEGGTMSVLFAAAYPQRVSALVLASTSARFLPAPDYPCGPIAGAGLDTLARVAEEDWGRGGSVELFAPALSHSQAARANIARWERLSISPGMLVDYLEINKHLDVRSVLPALQVPTLVLHRSGDPVFEPFHSRYLADHIPQARRLELPGGNHILWDDDHAVADAIEEFLTGAKGDADLDRVLTTVVFTDIVGSTERAQALGDRQWRRLLDGHDDLARRHLDGYRGHLVKTTGDGVLATFDGPARAVRCACAIRDGVADLGLEVRAGVHTGEVELRGDDVGGITVHIGQRIAALADPGQVLVSGTVHDLVFGSGLAFDHRGARTLRGVPGTWPVFAVSGRGSPGE